MTTKTPKAFPKALIAIAVAGALSLTGCASWDVAIGYEEPVPVQKSDRFDQILETHAKKVSSAWVRLADVREAVKRSETAERRVRTEAAIATLDLPAPPTVFSGDIEAFLAFLVADMKGWTVAPPDGRKQSVSHIVNIRSSEGETYRDILMDASRQVSGSLEIVANPSAQSLRVRYPAIFER